MSATRIVAAALGPYAGLLDLVHGAFELQQRGVNLDGPLIQAILGLQRAKSGWISLVTELDGGICRETHPKQSL